MAKSRYALVLDVGTTGTTKVLAKATSEGASAVGNLLKK